MAHKVYMTTGEPTAPKSTEELLDGCWLNGNIALIRAFVTASAERFKFQEPKVSESGYNTHHENHSMRVTFNTAAAKNRDYETLTRRSVNQFEQDMVNIFGAISKHLGKGQSPQEHCYSLPLYRGDVVRIGNIIKAKIATELPPSTFISHLKKQ